MNLGTITDISNEWHKFKYYLKDIYDSNPPKKYISYTPGLWNDISNLFSNSNDVEYYPNQIDRPDRHLFTNKTNFIDNWNDISDLFKDEIYPDITRTSINVYPEMSNKKMCEYLNDTWSSISFEYLDQVINEQGTVSQDSQPKKHTFIDKETISKTDSQWNDISDRFVNIDSETQSKPLKLTLNVKDSDFQEDLDISNFFHDFNPKLTSDNVDDVKWELYKKVDEYNVNLNSDNSININDYNKLLKNIIDREDYDNLYNLFLRFWNTISGQYTDIYNNIDPMKDNNNKLILGVIYSFAEIILKIIGQILVVFLH